MDKISEDLVQRMAACIQAYVTGDDDLRGAIIQAMGRTIHAEFVAIAAELPKPIDPDLIEARKVVAAVYKDIGTARAIMNGNWDSGNILGCALAALKRGRELASGAA